MRWKSDEFRPCGLMLGGTNLWRRGRAKPTLSLYLGHLDSAVLPPTTTTTTTTLTITAVNSTTPDTNTSLFVSCYLQLFCDTHDGLLKVFTIMAFVGLDVVRCGLAFCARQCTLLLYGRPPNQMFHRGLAERYSRCRYVTDSSSARSNNWA